MFEAIPVLIAVLLFGAVAAVVFVLGQYAAVQAQTNRRLPTNVQHAGKSINEQPDAFRAFVVKYFDERRFGLDNTRRGKLRSKLLKAGYFTNDALNYYIFARVVTAIGLPVLTLFLSQLLFARTPWILRFALVAVSLLVGLLGPDAYISRRQGQLAEGYRQSFPDLLDLLTVCIDAGLSLQAALDRVTGEIIKQNQELGLHLRMMGEEARAGRTTIEALGSLAERLGLDEAHSLVLVLRQSIELGANIGDALRLFSEEMRDKRLFRAEENANKLSVKLVLPLGVFIFPVILMVVLLPIVLKLMTAVFR